jgi:hypothetical protein
MARSQAHVRKPDCRGSGERCHNHGARGAPLSEDEGKVQPCPPGSETAGSPSVGYANTCPLSRSARSIYKIDYSERIIFAINHASL